MPDSASSGDEGPGGNHRANKAADSQKVRLERLMQNPDKLAHIPEGPKEKAPPPPAEFVRFYMGSSAGAGSGEFHIYRNLRRKEQNRMKFIDDQAKKDKLQTEFEIQAEKNRIIEEEKTAKKRAKRFKKKAKNGNKKQKTDTKNSKKNSESEKSDEEEEEDDDDDDEDSATEPADKSAQTTQTTQTTQTQTTTQTSSVSTSVRSSTDATLEEKT